MQPSLRKVLTSNPIHKVCSLIIGITVWGVISPLHNDMLTIEVPLCFYNTPQQGMGTLPQAPERITVTLRGKRSALRRLDRANLAAHVDTAHIDASGIIPRITEKNLLLPKTIKVVEYRVTKTA